MAEIYLIQKPIGRAELKKIAEERFGDLIKAVVDLGQGIMAVGGEFHSDEETFLIEKNGSKREDTWGINLYPDKPKEEMIEFDSVINIKPASGNRSRDVEKQEIKEKIKEILDNLVSD